MEILFFFVVLYIYHVHLRPIKKPPLTANPQVSIDSVIRHIDWLRKLGVYDPDDFFRFFLRAEPSDVRRGNMRSFLAWAICNRAYEKTDDKSRLIIENSIDVFIRKFGCTFLQEEGYNANVNHVNFTLQPHIPFIHRPLVVYICLGLLEMAGNLLYTLNGFQRMSTANVTYWYKAPSASSSTHELEESNNYPLLFMHGICGGYLGYLKMITTLGSEKEVILVDFDQIKICNFAALKSSPSPEHYAKKVKTILNYHRIEKISLVGHSFGTITATWFLKFFPENVAHLTLLDPVCILLGLPDVAINMIYRNPTTLIEYGIFFSQRWI